MKVITAVESYEKKEKEIAVFLAGVITNCPPWQDEVIKGLKHYDDIFKSGAELVVYNPRRKNFDVTNPNATMDQILWEFNHLKEMDVFSMYFCAGDSDQPICMYELGRHLSEMQHRFPDTWHKRIQITVEKDYKREKDVYIQTMLATGLYENEIGDILTIAESDTDEAKQAAYKEHANAIYTKYLNSIVPARLLNKLT